MTTQTHIKPVFKSLAPAPLTTEQFNDVVGAIGAITDIHARVYSEELFHNMGIYTCTDGAQHLVFVSRLTNAPYINTLYNNVFSTGSTAIRRQRAWAKHDAKLSELCTFHSHVTPLTILSFFSVVLMTKEGNLDAMLNLLSEFLGWLEA